MNGVDQHEASNNISLGRNHINVWCIFSTCGYTIKTKHYSPTSV